MARPEPQRKPTHGRTRNGLELRWRALLSDPRLHMIAALLVCAIGVITILALFGVPMGAWGGAWIRTLHYCFGWGAYPLGVAILLAGVLWIAHQVDWPLKLRWRPIVGTELAFFGLLAFTHAILGRNDPWGPVGERWSGGLIGWALSIVLSKYLGWPLAALILLGVALWGLGLAFDLTLDDVRRAAARLRASAEGWAAARQQRAEPAPVTPIPPHSATSIPQYPITPPPPLSPSPTPPLSPSPTPIPPRKFTLPPLGLLHEPEGPAMSDAEILKKVKIIEKTLRQFGLDGQVVDTRPGPTVTQFGISPGFVESGRKVRVNQISGLADDLALALAAPRIRIEAPVPGRPYVGIEVPNSKIQTVGLREVMESQEFRKLNSPLAICLGRDVAGDPVVADLSRMPHLLVAGTTGSGKSVCIKAIISCMIYNNTPNELRLVLIDPKMVELVRFNGLPHVYGHTEVDLERIVKVLRWVAWEMDDRYKRFSAVAARHIDDYNRMMKQREEPTIPRIVVLIDELSDLMMLAPEEVERTLCRIAQMARATGIHLVVATQRPSTDVVTGLIKANFPARISFAVVSQVDSRVILDQQGAETLLGRGDMLYLAADAGYPVRVQGCYLSAEEEERLVNFWCEQVGAVEEEAPWERMMHPGAAGEEEGNGADEDELLPAAIALVKETGTASASLLQRRLRIGHPRAARLMRLMEEQGIIGPPEAAGRTRSVSSSAPSSIIIGGDEEPDL